MYKITDVVEIGHLKYTGGTIKISFLFDDIVDNKIYFDIIDYLDHCLITDDDLMKGYSDRFIILFKCKNLFKDIHMILSYFLRNDNKVKDIIITRGKECYSSPPVYSYSVKEDSVEIK